MLSEATFKEVAMPNDFSDASRRGVPYPPKLDRQSNSILALVAGPFAEQVMSVWGCERVHEYLSATDTRRQVWHSWLVKHPDGDEKDHLMLSLERSRQILSHGYGSCPDGLVGALSRLGPKSRSRDFYLALFDIMRRGGPLAKLVMFQEEIAEHVILALGQIPGDDLATRATAHFIRTSVSPRWFSALIWVIRRLEAAMPESGSTDAILRSSNPIVAAKRWASQLPFPAAPWPAQGSLQPVTSAAELAAVAKHFRNCLRDRRKWMETALAIQAGRQYCYRWDDTQPALLLFSRCAGLGWSLADIAGPENADLTSETRRSIHDVLTTIAEICPTDPDTSAGMMFEYF